MKTSPSYPTRHPNWIDVDPETELEKNNLRARFIKMGLSFKWAFLIVLGFHVILLCGIYASSSLKPKAPHPTASVETPTTTPDGPKSDALARNEWPQPDATPEVKALPPAPKKVATASKPAPAAPNPAERITSPPYPRKRLRLPPLQQLPPFRLLQNPVKPRSRISFWQQKTHRPTEKRMPRCRKKMKCHQPPSQLLQKTPRRQRR